MKFKHLKSKHTVDVADNPIHIAAIRRAGYQPVIEDETAKPAPKPKTAVPDPVPAEPDDLTAISGIGKARAKELNLKGIDTYAQLAAADTDHLHDTMEVSRERIEAWQKKAESLSNA